MKLLKCAYYSLYHYLLIVVLSLMIIPISRAYMWGYLLVNQQVRLVLQLVNQQSWMGNCNTKEDLYYKFSASQIQIHIEVDGTEFNYIHENNYGGSCGIIEKGVMVGITNWIRFPYAPMKERYRLDCCGETGDKWFFIDMLFVGLYVLTFSTVLSRELFILHQPDMIKLSHHFDFQRYV